VPTNLLKTKLFIPPARSGLVSRPRLIERLNASQQRRLTLISAPAGFGKTTLLSEWIASKNSHKQVAWLSLEKNDNDPVLLLSYIISAIRTIEPNFGSDNLETLQTPQPPPIHLLFNDLINDITGISNTIFLILDDFHLITAAQTNELVNRFVENLPQQIHLIISTRTDPSWRLAHMRAVGEMVELRAEDLRFTPEEVSSFLNLTMRLELSDEEIAALDARTEGWIAGLQLAALSIRGRDANTFIRAFSGSHRYILDYLTEEVLDQQPPQRREFLLKTSILDRMTASLCNAVTQSKNSQEVLEELEQTNLFLTPLDDERVWYRYHHLFADLLRNQLILSDPEGVSILHQCASEWFEEQGFTEETISHAFAAEDTMRVARLVEKFAWEMLQQNKYSILYSWIEALPDELVVKSPWLCVYKSWTRHWAGIREGGEDYLDIAEESISRTPALEDSGEDTRAAEVSTIPGYIATVRAHYAVINEEISRAVEQANLALRLLPVDDYFTRGTAGVALGAAYWGMGDVHRAEAAFAESASNSLKGGFNIRATSSLCYMGMQQVKQSRLQEAEETFREALILSTGPGGRRFPTAGYPLAKLGELRCEWNDLEQATADVFESVELCTQLGHVDLLAEAYVALARVQLAQRDYAGVSASLKHADRLSTETKLDAWIDTWLDDCRLRLWLNTGNLEQAQRWVRKRGLRADDPLNYHHELEHINLARVMVAIGIQGTSPNDQTEVLDLLDRLLGAAESADWVHVSIKILVLKALALSCAGSTQEALVWLVKALTLAEPGGYIRTFVDEGRPMGKLLQQTLNQGVRREYVGKLLSTIEVETAGQVETVILESLSPREMEVLGFLVTDISIPEIAGILYITEHTVRSHVKSIYGKLDVHSRIAAVQRAKELKLIK